LSRESDADVRRFLEGNGYDVYDVAGDEPTAVHQRLARVLDDCVARIRSIQREARTHRAAEVNERPRWPAIVLRTPKGWTGPRVVDGKAVEGTFRSHQVPLPHAKSNAAELAMLEAWLRSYRP